MGNRQQKQQKQQWLKLASIPNIKSTKHDSGKKWICCVNYCKIVIFSGGNKPNLVFDYKTNEWNENSIDINIDVEGDIIYNKETNTIYELNKHSKILYAYNLSKGTCTDYEGIGLLINYSNFRVKLVADTNHYNTLHLIVPDITKHFILTIEPQKKHILAKEIKAFQNMRSFNSFERIRCFYIKSKEMIIAFCDSAFILNVGNQIYEFSVKQLKWRRLDINFPEEICNLHKYHIVPIHRNDKYILIIGGKIAKQSKNCKLIYIYNVENHSFKKCNFNYIGGGIDVDECLIVDEIKQTLCVINGYIEGYIDGFVPVDIVNMIAHFIGSDEYLHIIHPKSRGKHWKVPVSDIVSSVPK